METPIIDPATGLWSAAQLITHVTREFGRAAQVGAGVSVAVADIDDFVVRALQSGARGYLLKSCSAQELADAVSTVAAGGHYVTTELSDALVRSLVDGTPAVDPYEALSDREREVFYSMAQGRSNALIGDRLFISERTVETHRARILKKLGLRTQTDIVLYALRRGVIRLDA